MRKIRRTRLDSLLVELGYFESREKAKLEIMAGNVYVNDQLILKPSRLVNIGSKIEVRKRDVYVSRGAYKLKGAVEDLGLDVKDKIACDIGASTGGFTQVLLELGAKKVYAVDVGRGQLHWKLRNDTKVVVMEKVNARYLKKTDFPEDIQVITCDVSFISISKILPSIFEILVEGGEGLILVKPQFEAPREYIRKGLIRNMNVHIEVLKSLATEITNNNFSILGLTFSKIKGQKGNIEYFYKIKKESIPQNLVNDKNIEEIVSTAWKSLDLKEGVNK
ncbi:MAG: rRNA (cytidine1920-2-O)/16S rRNA (cytidine1409-2-O)-methyltransferase [Thermotogaceae bacterium]|nr:rRNA (cytidine1920-2-O)/16S rRNA (cytidine1409-2-O)-methyltransferase [Thermotogaceae bacterium]